ncbi:MAG: Gfo/Idh/MocA family oxidoreductase [Chloroflexi bacterium]|nr:Gfo/Idh/MocA family oxidoreductase [Chloroflexota bacterium]
MIRFGVVGAGWRARFFLKIARACPDRFEVTGIVTRDRKRAAKWLPPYDVPLFKSLDDLIETRPQFVVTSVPWGVNPSLLTALANKDMPALSETPPATTLEEMIDLWHLVEYGAKIAVFGTVPPATDARGTDRLHRVGPLGPPNVCQCVGRARLPRHQPNPAAARHHVRRRRNPRAVVHRADCQEPRP